MPLKGTYIWNGTVFTLLGTGEIVYPVVTPPEPTSWDPSQMSATTWSRPTTGQVINTRTVVNWEDLVSPSVAAAQAASPSTPVLWTAAQAKAVTGGVIVSFPAGIFECENGYQNYRTDTNRCGFGIGAGYATGIAGYTGAGSRSTPGPGGKQTILRMNGVLPNNSLQFDLVVANGVSRTYHGGYTIQGVQARGDGCYHSGLVLRSCPDSIVENMTFIGAAPGYDSAPPGETFQLNVFKSDRTTVRDNEFDGRDKNGLPTTASWGWNTCDDAVVERCWYHDGLVGMLTFWETVNIRTVDYWCDRVGFSGVSGVKGSSAGINHEQSEGTIVHIRPHLYMKGGRTSGTFNGAHMTMHSVHADVGANMRIEEPDFEPSSFGGGFRLSNLLAYHPGAAGRFNMTDWATRYGFQYTVTNPTIIKNGKELLCSPQFTGMTVDYSTDPDTLTTIPASAGGVSGWNQKDPTVYYVKTNG